MYAVGQVYQKTQKIRVKIQLGPSVKRPLKQTEMN